MLDMYDEKEILREYIESEKYEAAQEASKQVLLMEKIGYISDTQVVKRATAAVKIELEKKKALDIPIAVYDRKTQTIYEEESDGSRKVVGERLRRERYSERIAKKPEVVVFAGPPCAYR